MRPVMSNLVPLLIVRNAHDAIDFYVEALGAKVIDKFVDDKLGGVVVHASLEVRGARFSVAEETRDHHNLAPTTIGGTAVILHLGVENADGAGARLLRHGATVVFPIADQFYGAREGRFKDPFGHFWIISQPLQNLSADEIQRKIDRFHDA